MRGGASGTVVVPTGQAKAGRVDVGDGVSLWYREWGNPAGTPVVFVHGGRASATSILGSSTKLSSTSW
eukprot:scaffold23245_cov78-Phaeocystis_antarctica.AAC.1